MEAVEHYVEKFQPEHYRLFLDINRREKRFTGTVAIKGLAISQEISLHQKGLEISSVMVAGQALDFRMDEEQSAQWPAPSAARRPAGVAPGAAADSENPAAGRSMACQPGPPR